MLGRWDVALTIAAEEQPHAAGEIARSELLNAAHIHCERGDLDPADALLAAADTLRNSDNPQIRAGHAAVEARLLRADGQPTQALVAAEQGLATLGELAITDTNIKTAWVEACEAALALPDLDKADELLAVPETLDPGQLTPLLHAHSLRLRARLDAARDTHNNVDERFRAATALYREFDLTFHQAVSQLEHADWLTSQNRADEASHYSPKHTKPSSSSKQHPGANERHARYRLSARPRPRFPEQPRGEQPAVHSLHGLQSAG